MTDQSSTAQYQLGSAAARGTVAGERFKDRCDCEGLRFHERGSTGCLRASGRVRHAQQVMVNGEQTTVGQCADECDYCGEIGHTWHKHGEARADVVTWQRQSAVAE